MPNWVFHYLTITGAEDELNRFIAEGFTEEEGQPHLNFDKLISREAFPWHAYKTKVQRKVGKIKLYFETPNVYARPVLYEFAKRFPRLTIKGRILEEMYGFGGNVHIHAGKAKFEDKSAEIRAQYDKICTELGNDIAGTGLDVLDPSWGNDEPAP